MEIYVILVGTMIVLYFVMQNKKNGRDNFVRIIMLILYFVSSFRANIIGSDYQSYINIFNWVRQGGFSVGYEKGYVLLNMLANILSEHYVVLAMLVNMLIFISVYYYISTFVEDRYKCLVVFIFFLNPYLYVQSTFNIMRQGCATAVLLFAMHYLYKRQWIGFIVLVLIAAQFHKFSYIFLLMIIFRVIKWKGFYFIILSTISLIMNFVLDSDSLFSRIAAALGYSGYIGFGNSIFDFKLYAVFIYITVFFFILYYGSLYANEKEKFFTDLYLLSLSVLPVLLKNDVAYRIYITLVFMSIPAVSFICKGFNSEKKRKQYIILRLAYFAYYFVFFGAFFLKMLYIQDFHYVPFKFFWQV